MDITPLVDSPTNYSNFVFGALGAITRVCYLKKDNEPLNPYKAVASIISGSVFAGAGGAIGGLTGMGSFSLGVSSFIAGGVGIVITMAAMDKILNIFGDSQ